jgi:hypothetical protein
LIKSRMAAGGGYARLGLRQGRPLPARRIDLPWDTLERRVLLVGGRARGVAIGIALAALSTAVSARAEGVCDPAGHFCIQMDTTSAGVCDLLRPGGLDPDTCSVQDAQRRERARGESPRPLRALTVRFDDWWVMAFLKRIDASGEIGPDEIAAQARSGRASMEQQVDTLDDYATPSVRRIHDVQTIWFDTLGTRGGNRHEQIDVEVRAADAAYVATFYGPPGARLHAFAESALATLDTLPAKPSQGKGEAVTWIVRGLVVAVVLAILGWWIGRKKGRGLDPRELWPR